MSRVYYEIIMKSAIKSFNKEPKTSYPCLKIVVGNTFIVLFTAPKTGTVVYTEDLHDPVGLWSSSWGEENFSHFNGELILSNDYCI